MYPNGSMGIRPGTNFGAPSDVNKNVTVWFRDKQGLVLMGEFTGYAPTTANEYRVGCQLIKTDASSGNAVYVNEGSIASPNFVAVF